MCKNDNKVFLLTAYCVAQVILLNPRHLLEFYFLVKMIMDFLF